jgi:hypothetical protein
MKMSLTRAKQILNDEGMRVEEGLLDFFKEKKYLEDYEAPDPKELSEELTEIIMDNYRFVDEKLVRKWMYQILDHLADMEKRAAKYVSNLVD